jgi:type IV secretory pathway VirB2 component (pilin)
MYHRDLSCATQSALLEAEEFFEVFLRKALMGLIGLVAGFWPCLALAAVGVDPQGSGVLIHAVTWLQGTLLGTVATVVAVIAVACVGFMMLTGRINWRYGAMVILGCFVLFGAASIVAGIRAAANG